MKDYDLLNKNLKLNLLTYAEWRSKPKYHSGPLKESFKLTDSVRKKVFEKYGRVCNVYGSTTNLHIDHIIPLSKGGKTVLNNLQVLCRKCNLQKRDKTMEEFYLWRNKHGTK